MARTVNESAQAARRDSFLDATQRLIQTKGYEEMSIQEVVEEVGTSKGSFYYYFDSKEDVLQALIDRTADLVRAHLAPHVEAPDVSAPDKLQRLLGALATWKVRSREQLLPMMRIWYSDGNATVRERTRRGTSERLAPLLAAIAAHGAKEGTMAPPYPDQAGRVAVALIQDLNESIGALLLRASPDRDDRGEIERVIAAYTDAVERVMGVRQGSLTLTDGATLAAWFDG